MKHELIIGKYTLESLTNGMYASPLDLYRGYIQNAVDSFDEAVNQGLIIPHKLRILLIFRHLYDILIYIGTTMKSSDNCSHSFHIIMYRLEVLYE